MNLKCSYFVKGYLPLLYFYGIFLSIKTKFSYSLTIFHKLATHRDTFVPHTKHTADAVEKINIGKTLQRNSTNLIRTYLGDMLKNDRLLKKKFLKN